MLNISSKSVFFGITGLCCGGTLATAFMMEYVVGFAPCSFCIYERYPYGIALALSLGGLFSSSWHSFLKKLLTLTFLVECALTIYHILIEHKVVAPPSSCAPQFTITPTMTVQEIQTLIESQQKVVRCDMVPLRIFGLSMAEWNLLLSLALLGFTLWSLCQKRRLS